MYLQVLVSCFGGTEVVQTTLGMCCIESRAHNDVISIAIKCDRVQVSAYIKRGGKGKRRVKRDTCGKR